MKTTNYEISKQLAKAGFKAENDFFWVRWDTKTKITLIHKTDIMPYLRDSYVKAYDLETILEALPRGVIVEDKYWELGLHFREFGKSISYNNGSIAVYSKENESLADTAARLWLKLKQEGFV